MKNISAAKSLWLAAISFLLAGIAQALFSGWREINTAVSYGWLVYALAAGLFVAGFGRLSVVRFAGGRASEPPGVPVHLFQWQWILISLGILFSFTSLIFFNLPAGPSLAWLLHILSVLLFMGAFLPFTGQARSISSQSTTPLSTRVLLVLAILGVTGIAVFTRLWQLGEFPYGVWFDEAINGQTAVQMLQDGSFRPIYLDPTAMPAHFNYLIALSFSLFGINVTAIRLVAFGFGILTILFAYLLFRRWFGNWIGILAALLLAVMRFHLTFSRFGMQGITTPAFELAALYFLDRALASKKVQDFAWLGLMIGFGLTMHTAFRLFPVVLGLFLAGLFIAALIKHGLRNAFLMYIGGMWRHWLIAVLAIWIAVAPVAYYALKNREQFFARTSTVSIFEKRDEPNLGKALLSNTIKHLEMFNIRGDRNGRHNLPGAPMLDPVMGALFILGAAYALWRWRDPANLLMLLLFLVMLQAGILSLDFEAPQSYRSIGVIPALVYFTALPLAAVTHSLNRLIRERAAQDGIQEGPSLFTRSWPVGVILLLAVISALNLNTFFIQQRNDASVWMEHSTTETIVAKILKENADQYDFVLSAMYDNHPTVSFLAGDVKNYQRWTVTDRFPLVRDPGRGVIILFDEKLLPAYQDIPRLYPHAKMIQHRAPGREAVVLYEARLTPEDLRAASGVTVQYFKGDGVEGQPEMEETLTQAAVDWSQGRPMAEPYTAELRSTLFAPEYGSYRFNLQGPPGAKLWIDENPVGDAPVTLARAAHTLRLQIPGSTDRLALWWQPPNAAEAQPIPGANLFQPTISNSGLLGAYYPTPDWSGEPAFTQVDPQLAFYFHIIPLPRPYSVEWTGRLYAPQDGDYKFALDSVDGSSLILDGQQVVDNPNGNALVENTTPLTRGWHDIRVRFSDRTGATRIYLYWTPPGAADLELIPAKYLSPPMGQYPVPDQAEN